MAKSSTCCLSGVMLIASLALNVAFITGCVSVDGNPPYFHIGSSDQSEVDSLKKEVELLKKERVTSLERLRAIAKELGMDTRNIDDEVVLKGKIIQHLLDRKEQLPDGEITEDDIARIDEQLTGGNKSAIKEACKFVTKLKGKKVIVIEPEEK